jgi:hypothetical protein
MDIQECFRWLEDLELRLSDRWEPSGTTEELFRMERESRTRVDSLARNFARNAASSPRETLTEYFLLKRLEFAKTLAYAFRSETAPRVKDWSDMIDWLFVDACHQSGVYLWQATAALRERDEEVRKRFVNN